MANRRIKSFASVLVLAGGSGVGAQPAAAAEGSGGGMDPNGSPPNPADGK